ncbi:MAG: hypothetical protein ACRCZ2_01440 [Fusobacteriaceae bacterium]
MYTSKTMCFNIIVFVSTLLLILTSCTSSPKPYGFKELKIIYNAHSNQYIGRTIMVKNLGDASMFNHEYTHALYYNSSKSNTKLG